MPRPRKDGTEARAARRVRMTERWLKSLKPTQPRTRYWDTEMRGLALVLTGGGRRSFYFVYRFANKPRWYFLGDATGIDLAQARTLARKRYADVILGKDVQAERIAERIAQRTANAPGTFEHLANKYRDEYAKRRNEKSWTQADRLVRGYLKSWFKRTATEITRADMRDIFRKITADGTDALANQVLASASAIFSWARDNEVAGIKVNPCQGIERNKLQSRERVLSDAEAPLFWNAFDDAGLLHGHALRVLLLCGQRPGEVCAMRREHVDIGRHRFTDTNGRAYTADGAWWSMPGASDAAMGWRGTKNGESHRVWLTQAAVKLIIEVCDDRTTGFVFSEDGAQPLEPLDAAMRDICRDLGIVTEDMDAASVKRAKVTPHDLRSTHGTTTTSLGFTREQMDRIQNHKDGGTGSVYDRHGYADEFRRIQEAVTARILDLAQGSDARGNVVAIA